MALHIRENEIIFEGFQILLSTISELHDKDGNYIDKTYCDNELSDLTYSIQETVVDLIESVYGYKTINMFLCGHQIKMSDVEKETFSDKCLEESKLEKYWHYKIAGKDITRSFLFHNDVLVRIYNQLKNESSNITI